MTGVFGQTQRGKSVCGDIPLGASQTDQGMQSILPSVSIGEADFHRLSYEDSAGRLFWRNRRLYRGLSPHAAAFYDDLFRRGVIEECVKNGFLVESWLTPDTMEGYPRIVEHSVIPFVSFPYEWCPEMLRSAGMLVLDLAAWLYSRDLALADAHALNVLFRGPCPVFVDLGSIQPASDSSRWPAAEQFRRHFINPLRLVSTGAGDIARSLMQTTFNGGVSARHLKHFSLREMLIQRERASAARMARHLLPESVKKLLRKKLARHAFGGSQASHLHSLQEELASIKLPRHEGVGPSYGGGISGLLEQNLEGNAKLISGILARISARSVLDIGANCGWYTPIAAKRGVLVVSFDTDAGCVSRLYSDACAQSLPVLPLVMDICNPSPARGPRGDIYPAAWERLRCELVIAFAIVHDLALGQRLTFDHIVGSLKQFSKCYLLVEFPNPEDYMVKELRRESDDWYTSDNFQRTLSRYFRSIERLPSNSDTSEIYFCEI